MKVHYKATLGPSEVNAPVVIYLKNAQRFITGEDRFSVTHIAYIAYSI